jgi:hypothetical protein
MVQKSSAASFLPDQKEKPVGKIGTDAEGKDRSPENKVPKIVSGPFFIWAAKLVFNGAAIVEAGGA